MSEKNKDIQNRSKRIASNTLVLFARMLIITFVNLYTVRWVLVVKELVKKHFRYNLIFAACACQSVSPGSALQRVDKGDGSLRYIDVAHYY